MNETVGVRELQQRASEVLRRVSAGETLDVTVRGRVVARLTPVVESPIEALLAAGLARRATVDPATLRPAAAAAADAPTLSELLAADRAESR